MLRGARSPVPLRQRRAAHRRGVNAEGDPVVAPQIAFERELAFADALGLAQRELGGDLGRLEVEIVLVAHDGVFAKHVLDSGEATVGDVLTTLAALHTVLEVAYAGCQGIDARFEAVHALAEEGHRIEDPQGQILDPLQTCVGSACARLERSQPRLVTSFWFNPQVRHCGFSTSCI